MWQSSQCPSILGTPASVSLPAPRRRAHPLCFLHGLGSHRPLLHCYYFAQIGPSNPSRNVTIGRCRNLGGHFATVPWLPDFGSRTYLTCVLFHCRPVKFVLLLLHWGWVDLWRQYFETLIMDVQREGECRVPQHIRRRWDTAIIVHVI